MIAITDLFSLSIFARGKKVIMQLRDAAKGSVWFPLTDSARFGEKGSTAFITINGDRSVGLFYGDLKITQGAGFASSRTLVNLDISKYKWLQLEVLGDGREYKILIKDATAMFSKDAYSHQAQFSSVKDKEQLITLDLKDFKPFYRGKIDNSLPPLKLSEVRELGIQINDGMAGPYKLEFKEWIVKK